MSVTVDLADVAKPSPEPFLPGDPGPFLHFKLDDTLDIERYMEEVYAGLDIAPRTVENAVRRGQLEFYQVGQKRYLTPKLIDKWLQSLVMAVKPAGASEGS